LLMIVRSGCPLPGCPTHSGGTVKKKYKQCSEKRHRAVSVSKKLHSHSPNFIIAPTALLIPYYVQQYLSLSCGSTPSTSSFQQGTSGQFACTCVQDCMHIFYFIFLSKNMSRRRFQQTTSGNK
jgi:hypothetical protein